MHLRRRLLGDHERALALPEDHHAAVADIIAACLRLHRINTQEARCGGATVARGRSGGRAKHALGLRDKVDAGRVGRLQRRACALGERLGKGPALRALRYSVEDAVKAGRDGASNSKISFL